MSFDYRTASRQEIQARAASLHGRKLGSLGSRLPLSQPSSSSTKGLVGRAVEEYFGIPPNSRAEADFPEAGIELKTVPILLAAGEVRPKERISLGMINPAQLAGETWEQASIRHKLASMLLVFYRWSPADQIADFPVLVASLWQPSDATMAALRVDWETIRDLAAAGRASEMSESLTQVLGAATKGPGGPRQTRAFALKQPFVGAIYREVVGVAPMATMPLSSRDVFENDMLALLARYVTWPVRRVAEDLGLLPSGGKAAAAAAVRGILGQPVHGRDGDFETYGVEVKTVPITVAGNPVEAMSFPAFSHQELVFETWESSDLLGRLNRLLIVPLLRPRGISPLDATIGRAFFWSPSEQELTEIGREWEMFRRLIEQGRADTLPKASETRYIHVRPKARVAADQDAAPGRIRVTKKSFWLNQGFVGQVVTRSDPRWRGY